MIVQQKIVFIASFCLASLFASAQKVMISGTVQQTFPYCGGARPTQEMQEQFAKPHPYIHKTFYVKKGTTNNSQQKVITQFTTDSNGYFSLKLPAGNYVILLEEQLKEIKATDYTIANQIVDESCLQLWWKKPYYSLKVKTKNIQLHFMFNHRCHVSSDIPCIQYNGPRPS